MTSRNLFKKEALSFKGEKGSRFWDFFGCETDWCAMFVSYLMIKVAGIDFVATASCSSMKDICKEKVNKDFKTAEIGDIILFETNSKPSDGPDHVGVVIDNNILSRTVTLIEGNTGSDNFRSSKVGTFTYPYDSKCFDCIIDMSEYFTDDTELDKLREKIEKIKQIIND